MSFRPGHVYVTRTDPDSVYLEEHGIVPGMVILVLTVQRTPEPYAYQVKAVTYNGILVVEFYQDELEEVEL